MSNRDISTSEEFSTLNSSVPSRADLARAWALDTVTAPVEMFRMTFNESRQDVGAVAAVPVAAVSGTCGYFLAAAIGYVGSALPVAIVSVATGLDQGSAEAFHSVVAPAVSLQALTVLTLPTSRTWRLLRQRDAALVPPLA